MEKAPNEWRESYALCIFFSKIRIGRGPLIPKQMLLIMRLTALLLLGSLHLSASTFSQTVTLTGKQMSLTQLIAVLEEQTNFSFFGNADLLKKAPPVSFSVSKMPLPEFLKLVLRDQAIDFEVERESRNVILFAKGDKPVSTWSLGLLIPISGHVRDSAGQPIVGATVKIKGSRKGSVTNESGHFKLSANAGDVLEISSIGFKTQEILVTTNLPDVLNIILARSTGDLGEVVINAGLFTRRKNSFTGAVATFTGEELKKVGNLNVLQSLRTLDPSFIITPNNQFGGNPNMLPSIELRGKTSIGSTQAVKTQFTGDPNQPLFILNGMETTLQQIVDLDMNRVASITVLKDAASTALYGSKAANGVVVVELKRAQAGELRITYNNDLRWEIPDLSDFNMMNAAELLEYQRLAGLYENFFEIQRDNDALYNQRLKAVKEGVNSYWLTIPLRQSMTVGNSVSVSGGNESILYDVSLNYRKLSGLMKGSSRDTWGGSIDLSYRKGRINVSNRFYVNGTKSNESPYGSYANYVGIAPYYRKKKADGTLNTDRYLELFPPSSQELGTDTVRVSNPLYNASLNNKNQQNLLTIQDQLQVIWDITHSWRMTGAFQISKSTSNSEIFSPAAHTMFDAAPVARKGLYTNDRKENWGYETYLMFTYNRVLGGRHSINGNIRGSLQEADTTLSSFSATGFPEGVPPNPAFAFGFVPDSKPEYGILKTRQVSSLASVNYSYAGKYMLDASYRLDGSTVFGSAKKYSPFWSLGVGWMLSQEPFLKNIPWIGLLRIRGNRGTSGNQQLGSFASASVYRLDNNRNVFGQGLFIEMLGNERLEWQKTITTSLGLDIGMMNDRLTVTFNAYDKTSRPLIVMGSAPTSTGVATYPLNVGELNTKGLEAQLRLDVIRNIERQIVWSIGGTASMYRSKYSGFGNLLDNLNKEALAKGETVRNAGGRGEYTLSDVAAALRRYLDGNSPDELWTVRSAGIDPATGREVFIKKNGEKTFEYDPQDIVASGNGRPAVEGVVNTNILIKGLQMGIYLRYSVNKYILNAPLYQKVENIGEYDMMNNQDKRALEMRWKNPGDIAPFKGISTTNFSPMSSRFIQKESFIAGESINVAYEFTGRQTKWLRSTAIKTIRLSCYMNDIFRLSSIRVERGTDYPFSKAVSFNVNLFF